MTTFLISPNYITVDGPDGAGSSTVAQALQNELVSRGKTAIIIEIPSKITPEEKVRLNAISDQSSPEVNLGYLAVTTRVYQEQIIPKLNQYDYVIAVGSELKNLFWAILDCNQNVVFNQISGGLATHGFLPSLRILVTAPAEVIASNLFKRKFRSIHDPKPEELNEIQARIDASFQAAKLIASLNPNSRLEIVHNSPPQPSTIAKIVITKLQR